MSRSHSRTTRRSITSRFFQPRIEALEDRCLLAAWTQLGPFPQLNQMDNGGVSGGQATSGRVTSLAFGTFGGQSALFLGSASGGVWRSTNYSTAAPQWTPLTDSFIPSDPNGTGRGIGLITTGSIAANGTKVYVGTGEANFSPDSRYGSGILRSSDGGQTWGLAYGQTAADEFLKRSITKVLVDPSTGYVYASVVSSQTYSHPGGNATLGVYESKDNGATWTKITGGTILDAPPDGSVVTDLEYTQKDGVFRLFVAVGDPVNSFLSEGMYIATRGVNNSFTWAKGLFPGRRGNLTDLTFAETIEPSRRA